VRDEEIAQDVRLRLDRNGFVDRHQVAVTAIDGTVYLTGTVDSPQESCELNMRQLQRTV
jgi:osmotically-inducible protein OsmY